MLCIAWADELITKWTATFHNENEGLSKMLPVPPSLRVSGHCIRGQTLYFFVFYLNQFLRVVEYKA